MFKCLKHQRSVNWLSRLLFIKASYTNDCANQTNDLCAISVLKISFCYPFNGTKIHDDFHDLSIRFSHGKFGEGFHFGAFASGSTAKPQIIIEHAQIRCWRWFVLCFFPFSQFIRLLSLFSIEFLWFHSASITTIDHDDVL